MSSNGSFYQRWKPVVDGDLIPDYPTKLLAEGKFARVPVISGYVGNARLRWQATHLEFCISATSNETVSASTNITEYMHEAYPLLTAAELSAYDKVYDRAQFSSDEEWIRTGTGEPMVRCGVSTTSFFHSSVRKVTRASRGRPSAMQALDTPKLGHTVTIKQTQRKVSRASLSMLPRIG